MGSRKLYGLVLSWLRQCEREQRGPSRGTHRPSYTAALSQGLGCGAVHLRLVVAIIVGTPAFRAPMFLLVGSLAVADLLAGLGLVLHFAADFCIGSPEMSLMLVGVLAMAFTASIGSLLAITVDLTTQRQR